MALVSDLVEAIAEVEDLPLPSVQMVARHLRESGFLSTGARGRNAPAATVTDAANLLIAVNANGGVVKDAPTTVLKYRGLILHSSDGDLLYQWKTEGTSRARINAPFDAVGFLRDRNLTLGTALETLVDGFSSGEIPTLFKTLSKSLWGRSFRELAVNRFGDDEEAIAKWVSDNCESYIGDVLGIDLTFSRPTQNAELRVGYNDGGEKMTALEAKFIQNANRSMDGYYRKSSGDRYERTSIGYKTLLKVGTVLKT